MILFSFAMSWRSIAPLLVVALLPSPALAAVPVSELAIDAHTGRTFYASAPDRVRPPASLTKMMTLLLAFEAIEAGRLRINDRLVMTQHGARQPPSRLGMAPGQAMSVRAALKTVAVVSANDVAVALAERLAGSEPAFVRAMNRRAARLGMAHTHFANATGLAPAGGTTTARDMALLARHLIRRFPERYRLFSARTIRWRGAVRPNHNRLLGRVPGVDGVKTGYTVPAGFNLVASAARRGNRVIVVVLGARSGASRDLLVANLLELGFSSPVVRDHGLPSRKRQVDATKDRRVDTSSHRRSRAGR